MPLFFRANPTFSAEAFTPAAPNLTAANAAVFSPNATPAANAAGSNAALLNAGAVAFNPALFASAHAVEIGDTLPQPIFLRAGKEVVSPSFNSKAVEDYLVHTVPLGHTKVPVTVSQSIPAGTRVAKGTPVDLVLATVSDIPFPIFQQFHADLAGKTVADLLPIATDATISPLLDKDEATLTADQKAQIASALATQNVHVVDTDATRNLSTALQSLRNARAFA